VITLFPSDRTRLAKLLGLLGSDHAVERDAVSLTAYRLICKRCLTWADVLASSEIAANRNAMQPWRETAADCLRQPGSLRSWEHDFLRSLSGFERISPKQKSVLDQIAGRILRRAAS
jgi:hypothetical protein